MTSKQRVRQQLSPSEQYAQAIVMLESIDPVVISSIEYEIATHLRKFQNDFMIRVKDGNPKNLTDAKTETLKHLIENMVEVHGIFRYEGIVPFENLCTDCNGFGFKMKFFRKKVKTVECKYCDKDPRTGKSNGYRSVPCKSCKGTGEYTTKAKSKIPCKHCNGTGTSIFKCNACRGQGEFHIAPIDSKIKSTTHCKPCDGRGFMADVPVFDPPPLKMDWAKKRTPSKTLTQNFGDILKAAQVKKE